jgi:hypothetical protein
MLMGTLTLRSCFLASGLFRVSEWFGILEINMDKTDDAMRVLITDPALQK